MSMYGRRSRKRRQREDKVWKNKRRKWAAEHRAKPAPVSETAAVKRVVARIRKGAVEPRDAGWHAVKETGGLYHTREIGRMQDRLGRRINKKLGQPHRRKDRGPLRAKAKGKNNVRPQRGIRR